MIYKFRQIPHFVLNDNVVGKEIPHFVRDNSVLDTQIPHPVWNDIVLNKQIPHFVRNDNSKGATSETLIRLFRLMRVSDSTRTAPVIPSETRNLNIYKILPVQVNIPLSR